jgi:alkylated DNA repair dioxygenase AlkB
MADLFTSDLKFPEGFLYLPQFLTEKEEEDLIEIISKSELHPFTFQGFEAKRKVASFGYDYLFDKGSLSRGKPIPPAFNPLIEKVSDTLSLSTGDFAELLITEYPVGAVINWHRDAPPFDLIAGISLLSDCKFRLRPYDKKNQSRSSLLSFPVKRRSMYVMKGPARTDWQHSIAAVKEVRFSITLRTLRKNLHTHL